MFADTSSENRLLSDSQKIKKSRQTTLDCNQNSTKDESIKIKLKLPHSIYKNSIENLLFLNISNGEIETLPDNILLLNNLQHLKINNSNISSLPLKICNLQNLKHLDVSANEIKDLPEDLVNLKNLQTFNISFNKLSKLPTSLSILNQIEELLISNNNFKSIPECVEEGMENLQILDISHNPIKLISPPASNKLKKFTAKGLKYCRIFPKWLLNPKYWKLKDIILDNSIFIKFPFNEKWFTYLRSFIMTNSSLSDTIFHKITSNMLELEIIKVDNDDFKYERECNKFCFLPGTNLKNPGSLKEISVRNTGLSVLSSSIVSFCNLKKLNVGGNNLVWLPIEICNLKNLEVFIIDNSKLVSLPEKFGELKKLEEFVVSHNKLVKLPDSMKNMENLKILDLFDNEFSIIPEYLGGEKLECLDLERNYFVIENISMRNTPYNILRERLRKHYNCQRDVGSKPAKEDETDDSFVTRSLNSKSDSESEEMIFESSENYVIENWGSPDNSADEYEPNREAKSKIIPVQSLYQFHKNYGCYFRPSDYHSRKIRSIIKHMKKKGIKKSVTNSIVDGQFDDA